MDCLRLIGESSVIFVPLNVIDPASTSVRRFKHRSSVDFPLPEGPTSAMISPFLMVRLMLFRICFPSSVLCTS
jgi:hypothetical protein